MSEICLKMSETLDWMKYDGKCPKFDGKSPKFVENVRNLMENIRNLTLMLVIGHKKTMGWAASQQLLLYLTPFGPNARGDYPNASQWSSK